MKNGSKEIVAMSYIIMKPICKKITSEKAVEGSVATDFPGSGK